jgi:hypothetical protein
VTDIAIVVRLGGLSEAKICENLQLFSQLALIARGLSRFVVIAQFGLNSKFYFTH